MIGTALYSVVRGLMHAGLSPNLALQLAAFVVIESALGREATEALGLPEATARRWRRQVARLDPEALPEEAPVEVVNEVLGLMGFDLRLRRPEAGE